MDLIVSGKGRDGRTGRAGWRGVGMINQMINRFYAKLYTFLQTMSHFFAIVQVLTCPF